MIPNGEPPDDIKNSPGAEGHRYQQVRQSGTRAAAGDQDAAVFGRRDRVDSGERRVCVHLSRVRQKDRRDHLRVKAARARHRRADDVSGERQAVHRDRGGRARRTGGVGGARTAESGIGRNAASVPPNDLSLRARCTPDLGRWPVFPLFFWTDSHRSDWARRAALCGHRTGDGCDRRLDHAASVGRSPGSKNPRCCTG